MIRKNLPVGTSDYKSLINEDKYYVDKTLILKDLIDQSLSVFFMLRPRRFGKSLLQSMIQTFFEDERDENGNHIDNSRYFSDKKILSCGSEYTKHMGNYPVIHLSLKDVEAKDFESAMITMKGLIRDEFTRHAYILESLSDETKEQYMRLKNGTAEQQEYAMSLKFLSRCLSAYHKKQVIILIDEYDVPTEKAWTYGYYDDMVSFIRLFFSSGLKDNPAVYIGVVTGCLRIAKESIYTGLNNPVVISVLTKEYDEYFGFTEEETQKILSDYDLSDKLEEVKKWYDGYLFGDCNVYNPWSIVKYVDAHRKDRDQDPEPYWSNTSANEIIRTLIQKSSSYAREDLETLMAGGSIEKRVHEDMTYEGIDLPAGQNFEDNIWNLLLFTGYLKVVSRRFDSHSFYAEMKIPNEEVRTIYENTIVLWFSEHTDQLDGQKLKNLLLNKDADGLTDFLGDELYETISCMDNAEAFYHGFIAGIMKQVPGYRVISNRETGDGRSDILLDPGKITDPVIILELKKTDDESKLEQMAEKAITQIEEKHYALPYEKKNRKVICYGIAFCRKYVIARVK